MKSIFFFLVILIAVQKLSAQEVFDNEAKTYYDNNTKVKNFYPLNLSNPNWHGDFKNPRNEANDLEGNAYTAVADRFGIPAQALYFRQYEHENLIIPSAVVKNIVDNDKGFSISAWIKVPDNGKHCRILSFINPVHDNMRENIQLRMVDGYFQILKTSSFTSNPVVMGQARYKISYDSEIDIFREIYPGPGEYGEGYIYFMLSSNKYSTRLYYSRPGGRLYANYFWFGLTDVLSEFHTITFGSPDNYTRTTILDAVDDIMVYNEMLSPEIANNNFLVQSPLYPSRSYVLRDFQHRPIAPAYHDEYSVDSNDILAKTDNTSTEGIYGAKRWLMSTVSRDEHRRFINFVNAKTNLSIGPAFNNPQSFYQQKNIESNSVIDQFEAVHIENRPDNLLYSRQSAFKFDIRMQDGFQLGIDENKALREAKKNMPRTEWSVQGSFNTSIREKFSYVSEAGVRIVNYGTGNSLAIEPNGFYKLYQSPTAFEPFRLVRTPGTYNIDDYQYGYENYRFYNMTKTGILTPQGGIKDTQNGKSQRLMSHGYAAFQLVYVKDDLNGKPLYMIRTDNGFGAKILVPDVHDSKLIVQNAHNEEEYATIPDNYLWSINVIYLSDGSHAFTKTASRKSSDQSESQMLQVYPNPVKGKATVQYTLPKSTRVKLYITSSTGALVKTIKEKPQNKGTYKESFTTSGWPSGLYFCNMQTDEGITTKKIIVQ
ncbi:MAG: T9SS type A sorting domain-containing protein [Chryseobacterium culicis]